MSDSVIIYRVIRNSSLKIFCLYAKNIQMCMKQYL